MWSVLPEGKDLQDILEKADWLILPGEFEEDFGGRSGMAASDRKEMIGLKTERKASVQKEQPRQGHEDVMLYEV